MMKPEFNLKDALAVLERTPASLSALLEGLPETFIRATEGEAISGGTHGSLNIGRLLRLVKLACTAERKPGSGLRVCDLELASRLISS